MLFLKDESEFQPKRQEIYELRYLRKVFVQRLNVMHPKMNGIPHVEPEHMHQTGSLPMPNLAAMRLKTF
jgi:hypothetical protein